MSSKKSINTSLENKANEGEETPSNALLRTIKQDKKPERRLQLFDPISKELSFACGDGRQTVYVNSHKQVKKATVRFKTKLQKGWVKEFVSEDQILEGGDLLEALEDTLKKYLHFEDKRLYLFESLWIAGTYLYSVFDHYGYLFLYSSQMRCGKTLNLEIVSHLAYEASEPLNAPTPASIREIAADGKTVQMDTLERWRDKSSESHAAAMDLLDAGFRKGGKVVKMISKQGDWRNKEYPIYAAYNLSGIKKSSLSDTALDRSFAIEMVRKPVFVRKNKYKHFRCEDECSPIRHDLYSWALQNVGQIFCLYESQELQDKIEPLALNDRAVDIWLPLFAILEVLGFGEKSAEWKGLCELAIELHRDPEMQEIEDQLEIIDALKQKADKDGEVIGTPGGFKDYLEAKQVESETLNSLLKEWGFEKKSTRLPDYPDPRKAWVLPMSRLQEIEERLIEILPYTPRLATTTTTEDGESQLEAFCTSGDSPGEEGNNDQ